MNSKTALAHFSMVGATLLFGINYWVAKGLMPNYLHPLQIIFLRISGALILIWLLELLTPKAQKKKIQKQDFFLLALSALLGITMNQILFFTGLNLTTAVDTAIINSSNPMIVMALSYFFLHYSLNLINFLGMILGAIGAILLIIFGNTSNNCNSGTLGNILILANTLCWSIYLIITQSLARKYHPFKLMRWVFLLGFIFSLPLTGNSIARLETSSFIPATWAAIGYIIIGTTFLAYLLIIFGLKSLSPPSVAVYTYLQPLIVAIIGILLYKESISMVKIIAAGLIFGGIYLSGKAQNAFNA